MANQDSFDHRTCDSDEQDHTSMTIEFLRARLLAERAVSKTARAKLDGLSDQVAELEEQLQIVSLQRKKAEQATADALAILKENGFTHLSDAYDSSSDHECYSLTNSVSGKSLSWKGRTREPASAEKIKETLHRRQRRFDSAYFSSSRHRQGRSCRQIKRSESRTVSEDNKRDINPADLQANGVRTEGLPNTTEEAFRTVVNSVKVDESLSYSNGFEKLNSMDINLERALKNRAQVIGSFEHMEETQKEWERKFTENKSPALECDVGNHSDVTDECYGEKAQAQLQGSTLVPSLRHTSSIGANEVEFRERFETLSPDNSVTSPDKCCKNCGSKSVEQDASLCGDNGKHISESPKSDSSHPQSFKGIHDHPSSTTRSPSVTRPNSRGGSFCNNVTTTIQKVDYPLLPVANEKSDTCDTVLTALKQAKLSLQEKVSSLRITKPEYLSESSYPSTPTYALPIEAAFGTKSSLPASSAGVEFPVSCAGLLRVPTGFSPDASRRNSFLPLSSQKALVSHIPERDIPQLPGEQLFGKTSTKNLTNAGFDSQLVATSLPLSTDGRLLTTPYIGGPKLWAGFRADGQPVVDTQESRIFKATPRVEGNQVSTFSFNSDTYSPMTPTTPSLYPNSVMRREMYSTPYYTGPVGRPPTGEYDGHLTRRA